jgi:S1-C subfamily serine protease
VKKLKNIVFILSGVLAVIFISAVIFKFAYKGFDHTHSSGKNIPVIDVKDDQRTFTNEEQMAINIYKDLSPSVVNITFYKTEYIRYFFDLYPEKSEGQGSGAIIDESGYIVTNYHVVGNADKLSVALAQGEQDYEAQIIGIDPENDLAVIKIKNPNKKFKPIPLGTSKDLKIGQKTFAIGNPYGLDRTLTSGLISGLGRPVKTEQGTLIEGAIQTDASINPGNSGGPLIDSSGKMIGITSMIISPSGGSIGLGFAIPIDTVRDVVDELLKYGYVKRGWIDATFLQVTPAISRELGYSTNYGLMVMTVAKGGEAYRSGLRGGNEKAVYNNKVIYVGGEIIVGIDNTKINDYSSLVMVLKNKKPGETVSMEYFKGNRKYTAQIKLIDKRQFTGEY